MVAKEALETRLPLPEYISELKNLAPKKAAQLDGWLKKYEAGKLPAAAIYSLMRSEIPYDTMMDAFEARVAGFKKHDMIKSYQHPILV